MPTPNIDGIRHAAGAMIVPVPARDTSFLSLEENTMTHQEEQRTKSIIELVAKSNGKPAHEVRDAMQEALDAAWEAAWTPGNIHAQVAWQRLFLDAQKPTLEEFIHVLAQQI